MCVSSLRRLSCAVTLVAALLLPAISSAAPKVGAAAPAFTLPDLDGKSRSLDEFKGKVVVLEWTNDGCPFVQKLYRSGKMQSLQRSAAEKGVVWLTVNSSAPGKQGHVTPDQARTILASQNAAPAAALLDPDGKVGMRYGALATPHMYVIDAKGTLRYMGAIDDKPTVDVKDVEGAKNYVEAALAEVLAGKPVTAPLTRAYGCNVKYPGS